MFPLETERLLLRPFIEQDVDAIYTLVYADGQVQEAWSGYTGTLDAFRLRFAQEPMWHGEGGFGFLAVVRKVDDHLLGLMGFQRFEPGEDTSHMRFEDPTERVGYDPALTEVELTYALGRPYWGQGYATEAGQALIELGFRKLGIDRIINSVLVHPDHRSLALIERLGFRVVENLNSQVVSAGPFAGSPGAIGILTRATWKASHSDERGSACRS